MGLLYLKLRQSFLDFLSIYGYSNLKSLFRLWRMKDKYRGKRCFIIGNGPSLKKTNLALLKNEYTFGLNRIYLLFKEIGFETSFYVCINNLVISQIYKDINKLRIPKLLSTNSKKIIDYDKHTVLLRSVSSQPFPFDPTQGVWEGATVTYVAMQIAYYLGFTKVILLGVDHNFITKGEPHKIVSLKGDDQNHFSPDYFKGFKWQLPDLKTSELAYRIADYVFKEDDREIVDATVGGKLDIFPKVKLEELFN